MARERPRLTRPPVVGLALGLIAVGCTAVVGCGDRTAGGPWRGPGTVRMAERLEGIAASGDLERTPYAGSVQLERLRAQERPASLPGQLTFRARLAQTALHAGHFDEGIAGFDELYRVVASHGDRVPAGFRRAVLEQLAAGHLKRWERENCVLARNSQPCILGLESRAAGAESAARSAAGLYGSLLEADPENFAYRWLLNVAYMRLGEHPSGVADPWLIPPSALRSEHEIERFREIAAHAGLDVSGQAGGSIMDDFDGDGDLDIVASSFHLNDQIRLFRNDGGGTFSERTSEAGLTGIVGGLNLVHADYDNDGDLDIFVLRGAWTPRGQPNSLLRNNGDGTFEDVTEAAGLLWTSPTQTASWGDYDNDGWIDLYVGNETGESNRFPNQLFHNNGDGTFSDVAPRQGVAVVGFVKAVVWGDIDNDGLLDLFISRLNQPNLLLRNGGPEAGWRFDDVTGPAGVAEPVPSFPAWFWDYDNDGWLDIFVSGYRASPGDLAAEYLGLRHRAEPPRLYRNNGDGTFRNVAEAVRLDRVMLTMGSNYGDLDNDGYEDFYVGTGDPRFETVLPNRMFRNAGGTLFQDVTVAGGFGHLQKGHGVAFGDLDGDGDQDIYATIGGAFEGDLGRNVLFENPGHGNRWVTLRLVGTRSNRAAIGARIRIVVRTGSGARAIHRIVSSGGSFGANSLQQEVGLGRATAIDAIEVTWPATGETVRFSDIGIDRVYIVREGEPNLRVVR